MVICYWRCSKPTIATQMTKSHSSETMPMPSNTLPGGMLLLHGLGMLKMKHVGCSRMAFDGCCPDCKVPGDDCPLIWGACNHAFHLHCILKWVTSQTLQTHCLMCHREWQFKGGDQTD